MGGPLPALAWPGVHPAVAQGHATDPLQRLSLNLPLRFSVYGRLATGYLKLPEDPCPVDPDSRLCNDPTQANGSRANWGRR